MHKSALERGQNRAIRELSSSHLAVCQPAFLEPRRLRPVAASAPIARDIKFERLPSFRGLKVALVVFRSRVPYVAVFAWSDLISDRSRKLALACSRPQTRAGGDPGPDLEHYELFHAQSSDTRCSRPFVAAEPRYRRRAMVSRVKCEGPFADSTARLPLRGRDNWVEMGGKGHFFSAALELPVKAGRRAFSALLPSGFSPS